MCGCRVGEMSDGNQKLKKTKTSYIAFDVEPMDYLVWALGFS